MAFEARQSTVGKLLNDSIYRILVISALTYGTSTTGKICLKI